MLDIALKNIKARKTRSILCVTGVMICVFLMMTVDGMLSSMREEINKDLARYMGGIFLQQPGAGYPALTSSINESIADEVLTRDDLNLDESTPILFLVIVPAKNPMEYATIMGVGITPGKEKAYLAGTKVSSGSGTLQNKVGNAVILGHDAAEYYLASVGKPLEIHNNTYQVVGILEYTGVHNIDGIVMMQLSCAQVMYDREGVVSTVLLTAKDIHDVDRIASNLEREYPNLEAMTHRNMIENAEKMMEMPNRFMGMISTVVFVVTIVIIMNVMIMAIKERTRDIGTLRAIGAKRRTILSTILCETLVLSIVGGLLGILISIPTAHFLEWAWIISTDEVVKIAFLVAVVGIFSGLYPAYKATRVDPLEALRYE
jgi:putative ABC transport system permease protein